MGGEAMSDQQQRTQWALDLFQGFCSTWSPPGARIASHEARRQVEDAIRAIAPKDDGTATVGWAVFKRENDRDYDRERPSGWVHTQVGAVFETMTQVANVRDSCAKKDPTGHYLICEIREIP
jgi:hypothetical protein